MRTKGFLNQHLPLLALPYDVLKIEGVEIARVMADGNASHLVACWNAVESIGGDPETVAKMIIIVRGATHGECDCDDYGEDFVCNLCNVCSANTLLAKIKETP